MTFRLLTIAACFALFAGAATPVLAAPPTAKTYQRTLATALVDGVCAAAATKSTPAYFTMDAPAVYAVDNQMLHTCLYIQEIQVRHCIERKSCPSYEAWSEANPQLSPNVSREVFALKFEAQQSVFARLHAYQKTTFNAEKP